ncbi:MAG TPA: rhodanese-like domain-containing protein [Anaeromyxobacter sp.]|nr:rhodanese-like domain-containing protein [Anaeromyxobacter sp.]
MRIAVLAAVLVALAPDARAQEHRVIGTDPLAARMKGDPASWDFTLVDARTRVEFSESHIPGAVLVPARAVATELPRIVKDRARLVVFYCNGPNCTKTVVAAKAATTAGYTNVAEYREGLPGWGKSGRPTAGKRMPSFDAPAITPGALKEALASSRPPFVMDIRDAQEFGGFHVDGAVSMPLDDIEARLPQVEPGRGIVIVDHAGHQAPIAARLLRQLGRTDVKRVDGGMLRWQADGLPVAR